MSDFKPIETQEDLNAIIQDRVARAQEKGAAAEREKYSDYETIKGQLEGLTSKDAESQKQIETLNNTIKDLNSKIAGYEMDSVKTSVMDELKIPKELKQYITGNTAEEMKASASALVPFLRQSGGAPLRNPEAESEDDGVLAAFKKLNPNIKF